MFGHARAILQHAARQTAAHSDAFVARAHVEQQRLIEALFYTGARIVGAGEIHTSGAIAPRARLLEEVDTSRSIPRNAAAVAVQQAKVRTSIPIGRIARRFEQ